MRVQMPFGMGFPVRRALMKAHGVRERNLKQIVVTTGNLLENVGQVGSFRITQIVQSRHVTFAYDHDLERPDGPERNQSNEAIVLTHEPLLRPQLHFKVITKQTTPVFAVVLTLGLSFLP